MNCKSNLIAPLLAQCIAGDTFVEEAIYAYINVYD